ncbi:sensor histidine kinase [Salmonirosea aquatica]|uniref:histidine kinase n=1 Tax=Salmonirosea aquatica TaxID=2654236 RepID=A0A7C9FZ70_9BACT|nr:sensor histidine kinase [Cytophagaceae bacterium SJW1-29]
MTKRRIQHIVGLMCLALIGLIGFQWYFIREAIAVRNEQFNHKVAESVQQVVHRLEKQEMMYLLQQRIENEQQKARLEQITKVNEASRSERSKNASRTRVAARQEPVRQTPVPTGMEISIGPSGEVSYQYFSEVAPSDVLSPNFRVMAEHQQRIIEEFFQAQQLGAAGLDEFMRRRIAEEQNLGNVLQSMADDPRRLANTNSTKTLTPAKADKPQKNPSTKSQPQSATQSDQQTAAPQRTDRQTLGRRTPDRADLLREVMQDLMYTQRPIEERVNRFLLDSLLKKELIQNGITLPYEFAVRAQANKNVLFSTAEQRPGDWEQRAYKASLFPSEMLSGNNLLYVYFPDQKSYILRNMSAMFASSGVLVLVILICFYVAVSTILKQKKLSDIKNDFINNMTHEFRTPISTIALATDMARENAYSVSPNELPTRIDRYLGIIREENRRLGTHVEKVLQMALLDKGEVKLKQSPVNMHDVIAKVLNSLSVQIEQRGGEVELDFEASEELVQGDEVHLTNVLYNLVDNAIKYSPQKLHLTVRTTNEREGIRIAVTDEGLGLSREQTQRIFDKFYRVPTGNLHNVKGFGLGLSYVKKMIDAHGGTVQVTSEPGQGSTFSLWLPVFSGPLATNG